MATTSTDGMIRRLGGKRWRRLHSLIYPATLLAVVHFFMQTRFDVTEPWIMAGLFFWLMSWRAVVWRGLADGRLADWWPMLLAILAALVTALARRPITGSSRVEPSRMLAAHLMLMRACAPPGTCSPSASPWRSWVRCAVSGPAIAASRTRA
jgi:sulfoxide reductase heme-binding subunit YedZ